MDCDEDRSKLEGRHRGLLRSARNDEQENRHCEERSDEATQSDEDGFTLVELMVVIVIIGLLATIVVINVMPAADRAAVTKARADIATLEQGIDLYQLNNRRYPTSEEGLQALVAQNSSDGCRTIPGTTPIATRAGAERRRLHDRHAGRRRPRGRGSERMKISPTDSLADPRAGEILLSFAGQGGWLLLDRGGVVVRGAPDEVLAATAGPRTALVVPGDRVAIHWLELAEDLAPAQAAAAARLMLADASAAPLADMHVAVGQPEDGLTPVALAPVARHGGVGCVGPGHRSLPSPLLLLPPPEGLSGATAATSPIIAGGARRSASSRSWPRC